MNIYLFGAPGSGKTTMGTILAERLGWHLVDTDQRIENETGMPVTDIFLKEGEAGFRAREKKLVAELSRNTRQVVALGGGTLIDAESRAAAEASGVVLCISCDPKTILDRMGDALAARPLLAGTGPLERLQNLLEKRAGLYGSFPLKIDTTGTSAEEAADKAQLLAGTFRVGGMGNGGYEVIVHQDLLGRIGEELTARKLRYPMTVITDQNVARHYLQPVLDSLARLGAVSSIVLEPGEPTKSMCTVESLYGQLIEQGMDRRGTIVALGGGMVTDVAGYAAATFMRGIAWVAVPTSLLGMVDAAVGGKTAVDLPQGKNLVGAFHPPAVVLADFNTLASLPEKEMRAGMAEVIKSAVVGDSKLMALLERLAGNLDLHGLQEAIRRAVRVKIRVVEEDPFERRGPREALNFGHTIGHAIELHSEYRLSHGESVALGMICEGALAEQLQVAEAGLRNRLTALIHSFGLPVRYDCPPDEIIERTRGDKKRSAGRIRWALPVRPGRVRVGLDAAEEEVRRALELLREGTAV
jgi:shikimate kinase / 3-dehydroquinate synthase